MARFFIDRPIFAMVIAIIIVILGLVAIPSLPVASYPQVVPPQIQVTANYLGGNAADLEKTVAQPIEEQLVGLDGMLYYQSTCSNNGALTVTVTFKLGTDPDIAAVQTQNRVSLALPRLPPEVQRQGVNVKKVSSAFLMAVSLISPDGRYDSQFLTNYAQINLVNQLGSLNGVGEARLGSQELYSMRAWIDPDKLTQYNLTATDVSNAVAAQNKQNPAGSLGEAPAPKGTDMQYSVSAPGRLTDPKQFEDIVLRATPDASLLKVRDVGRVELGSQTYSGFSRLRGKPSSNVVIYLAPGANAVKTAESVLKFVENAKKNFPAGVDFVVPYNSTMFVKAAIEDVVKTLLEAIALVILVVFIFLQNWRATMIPLLTVPVSIIGTFALFPLLGFSINITSMFGLILAIGIVVDDAIVVVEAVQSHIDEGMNARDATIKAMEEVSGPVMAIAIILAAVFVPVAFIGGISGEIFKQFALTIAVSVLISALSALTLSPALSSILLKPSGQRKNLLTPFFGAFNFAFEHTRKKYTSFVEFLIRRSIIAVTTLGLVIGGTIFLFKALPTGFLPEEDQGAFFISIRLPDGASTERTDRATQKVEKILSQIPDVATYFVIGGMDISTGTSNSNVSTVICALKPWEERKKPDQQLTAILAEAKKQFGQVNEARIFAFGLPPILGLSVTGGFQFMLEDTAGGSIEALSAAADKIVAAAKKRPELTNVISTFRPSVPTYLVNVDNDKMQTLGISPIESYNTLQTFLGGLYVNDFNIFGRTWQVRVQADPKFRDEPADLDHFYVRGGMGDMVPVSTIASIKPSAGPDVIYRYNRFRAVQILGGPAPGYSSGQATQAMQEVANANIGPGLNYEWTGTTFQEKQAQGNELAIYGLAAILVFLCLAALYEKWSIPLAVLFAVPLGMLGALLGIYLRGFAYDIYTQIGIVTLIGLSAKNAILIVEFAKEKRDHGATAEDAASAAANLRLRPILMTSFAFILGVWPLVAAMGASSGARRSLGTAVFSGMISATILAIFIVPVLYVLIENAVNKENKSRRKKQQSLKSENSEGEDLPVAESVPESVAESVASSTDTNETRVSTKE